MKAVLAAEIGDQMVLTLTMTKDELAQVAADPRILAEAVCEACGVTEMQQDMSAVSGSGFSEASSQEGETVDLCSGSSEVSSPEGETAAPGSESSEASAPEKETAASGSELEESPSCENREFIYKNISPDDLNGDKDEVVERVMRLLIAQNDIPVDMEAIEQEADFNFKATMQSIKYDILFRGVSASEVNVDPDELMAQIKDDLVFEKKSDFIFYKIIELEGFEANEDELFMEAEEMASRQNTTVDMVQSFFGRDLAGLAVDVKKRKVRDFLYMQARFEVLCREPFFACVREYDPHRAGDLAEALWISLPDVAGKTVFLMDVTSEKDYEKMIDALAPFAGEFVCVEAASTNEIVKADSESGLSADETVKAASESGLSADETVKAGSERTVSAVEGAVSEADRALSAEEVAALIREKGFTATACGSVEEGIKLSLQKAAVPERMAPVVAFGSRSMTDAIRSAFPLLCKRRQRRLATARRRALTQEERDEKSRVICDKLTDLLEQPEYSKVRTIFSYRGTWEEVNVDAFNNWAEAKGYRVAYPISLPHGIMKAAVPANENSWHRAAYDILEPYMEQSEILDPEDIDLIIVPCVAFDASGNRCGHGAGYYDRFMTSVKPEALVMVAFEAQRIETLMTEKTDLPIRTIVTEEGIIRI